MRSIGTTAFYALVIAFALLVMPVGGLASTSTIVDVPGAEAAGIYLRVTSLASSNT